MRQQHLQAYLQLIQELLSCAHGEEWTLLERNEQLVTPDLVQVMEEIAMQLKSDGRLDASKYLHHWAGQINHLFEEAVHHQSDDEKSQAYLKLIQTLLDCPSGSEVDILGANQNLIDPNLVRMMKQVATQMAARQEYQAARFLSNLAAEISRNLAPVKNFKANLQKDAKEAILDANHHFPDFKSVNESAFEDINQPISEFSSLNKPFAAPENITPSSVHIEERLTELNQSLINLQEILFSRLQPSNPLWYMDILERAHALGWVLTTEEVEELIGVKPRCETGKNSYQRGCWVFVKAGKMGLHTGWRVIKEEVEIKEDVEISEEV